MMKGFLNMSILKRLYKWYNRPNKSFIADTLESLFVILPVVFLIKTFIFGLYQVPTCSMETTMLVGERFFADKLTVYFQPPKHNDIISFNQPNYPYSKNKIVNAWEQYVSWNIINWTKRVIGVPGDHIEGRIEDGKPVVYRNGVKLDEPYVNNYPIIECFKPGAAGSPLCRRTFDPEKKWADQPFYRITPLEITRAKQFVKESIIYPDSYEEHDIFDVHLGPNQFWAMGDNRKGSWDSRDWGPLSQELIHGKILFRIWSIDSDESWWIVDLIKHPIDFWSRVRWSRFFNVMR